jgi:putative peptide zinc metalloprotease protein
VHQFLPFIRLDGYYIVSDLTGVPDMFARIRPTFASLIPWKPMSPRVKELKPWVRAAVTAYVLTVVPLLLFLFGMMVINAPRILATAYDALLLQFHKVHHDFAGGSGFDGAFHVLQIVVLLLPAAGLIVTLLRASIRLARGVWTKTEGNPGGRLASVVVGAGLLALVGWLWYPKGDYRPIQRGERGTLSGAVQQFAAIPTGRPALTQKRAKQLHDAPFQSSKNGNKSTDTTPKTSTTQPPPTTTASTPTTTAQTPAATETTATTATQTAVTPTTTSSTTP